MAALTETDVVAVELERVKPKVPVLFERDDTFFSSISKRPVETISARDMRIPLEIRPGGYSGHYDPAGGDLGRGSAQKWDKAVINTVHLRHAIEWQTKSDYATDERRKAVVNTTRHVIAKAMAEFRRNIDALCMTGGDGVLATISAVSTAASVDTYTCQTAGDGHGIRLLRDRSKINVYDATLATHRTSGGEVEITFYDIDNQQVQCAEVTGAVATDKIVASGLSGASPTSLKGVPYHHSNASTGTWLGFDRSTTPEVRANRTAAGGSLALAFPRLAKNKVGNRLGINQRKKCVAWMHPAQVQAYEELGQIVSIINKEVREQGLDLYFGEAGMQMAGAPVRESYNWNKTRIDFVYDSTWGRAELHPIGWYTVEGRKIFEIRGASGGVAASQVSYLVVSFNLFVDNPAGCSYIDTLTVPTGYGAVNP